MRSLSVCFTAPCLVLAFSLAACSNTVEEPKGDNSRNKPSAAPPLPPGPEKLVIVDEAVGTGAEVKNGDTVRVQYTGTLTSGKQFDTSRDKGKPFEFKVGTSAVIKGWDQGVLGMKVGGKRKLEIPSDLGYGASGHPPTIPANAGLKFDIELVEIVGPADAGAAKADAGAKPKADAGK